ncbi:TPA: hypothetical protein ACH3X2_14256 [Trebouxia sp. C0005]
MEVIGGLIPILMQQDPSPQGICGSLLAAMLKESCCCIAQCIQGMMTVWSCHIGRSSLASSHPEHPELPCTLSMKGGAIVPCHILNVHLELVPSRCAAESCGHCISLKEGLNLSCHEGFESRMGNDGRRH